MSGEIESHLLFRGRNDFTLSDVEELIKFLDISKVKIGEMKKAYHLLAKLCHPDAGTLVNSKKLTYEEATVKMQQINAMYEKANNILELVGLGMSFDKDGLFDELWDFGHREGLKETPVANYRARILDFSETELINRLPRYIIQFLGLGDEPWESFGGTLDMESLVSHLIILETGRASPVLLQKVLQEHPLEDPEKFYKDIAQLAHTTKNKEEGYKRLEQEHKIPKHVSGRLRCFIDPKIVGYGLARDLENYFLDPHVIKIKLREDKGFDLFYITRYERKRSSEVKFSNNDYKIMKWLSFKDIPFSKTMEVGILS